MPARPATLSIVTARLRILAESGSGARPSGRLASVVLCLCLCRECGYTGTRAAAACARWQGRVLAARRVVVTLLVLINGGFILGRTSVRWWWRWVRFFQPLRSMRPSCGDSTFKLGLPGMSSLNLGCKRAWCVCCGASINTDGRLFLCLTFGACGDY